MSTIELKTSVLDGSGMIWLENIPWQDAILSVLNGKAIVVQEYDDVILTVNHNIKKPRWIIKTHAKLVKRMFRSYSPTVSRVFHEYDGICGYCARQTKIYPLSQRTKFRKDAATRDHIWPSCRGGKLEWKNTMLACAECNTKKGGKSPEEARMKLLVQPRVPRISNGLITVTEAESKGLLV